MFLDANHDGRNDERDRLPHHGWSTIDVWLDTSRNRDGSTSLIPAEHQTVAAYEFTLQAGAIAVEWGQYTPAERGMKIVRGPLKDSLAYYVRIQCEHALGRGRHRLGSLSLRPRWGQGDLTILPCRLIGDTAGTSFEAWRGGTRFRLGPTVAMTPNPTVVSGEWYDADGVSFSSDPKPSAGPVHVEVGTLYLGWNAMKPPYELRVIRGRAVVNGFAPPERLPLVRRHVQVTSQDRALDYANVFAFAVARELHELGLPDSTAFSGLCQAYRLSSVIDSITVRGRSTLRVYGRGSHYVESLAPSWSNSPRASMEPEDRLTRALEEWATLLRKGATLQIRQLGDETIGHFSPDLDRAIRALQRRELLSHEDSVALLGIEPLVSRWKAIARPERLERVSISP